MAAENESEDKEDIEQCSREGVILSAERIYARDYNSGGIIIKECFKKRKSQGRFTVAGVEGNGREIVGQDCQVNMSVIAIVTNSRDI